MMFAHIQRRLFQLTTTFILLGDGLGSAPAAEQILLGPDPSPIEQYAARELQRYLGQLTGSRPEIRDASRRVDRPTIVLGQPASHPLLAHLAEQRQLLLSPRDLGPQGYVLKTLAVEGRPVLVIAGADEIGCLYGVYGLLEDHFGVRFYLGGDVLPEGRRPPALPTVDERKTPAVAVRGVLPWTNFPQSATSYSWEDWRFIIDQMAKMRLNLLHIHNYNGHFDANEPFHNFTLDGFTSRAWFASALTGHRWAGQPGLDPNKYRFGAADLFDDYDFGADCALHNETLSNLAAFRKGVSLFQRVIDYAHTRGVRIALGIELDVIPVEYGIAAEEPRVVSARVEQIATDYPKLDYLMCYQTEIIRDRQDGYKIWRRVIDQIHREMKARRPLTRIAVSGWGLSAQDVATLPEDVICAPIAAYTDGCESGAIYGEREYWGCPWLERDGYSSEYYYPYNMHLSNTIKAWQARAPNMKGFECLTWRLTDAIDPKMSFIARAPWDRDNRLNTSLEVYRDYAEKNYGPQAADAITAIINENEPVASDFGECLPTPPFKPIPNNQDYLINIKEFSVRPGQLIAADRHVGNHGTRKAACSEGGECVGFIKADDWLKFPQVDFGDQASTFTVRVAAMADGRRVELRLDTPEGPLLGHCLVNNTGDWQKWTNVEGAIEPTTGKHDVVLRFTVNPDPKTEFQKATAQLAVIDRCLAGEASPARKARLAQLRCRIMAARDHIELDRDFEQYGWGDLPGAMESWVKNFTYRVTDISSLGNVVSTQNRFVQLNYLKKERELRAALPPRPARPFILTCQPPSAVEARGTPDGAVIRWQNEHPGARGFFVYRDGRRLNNEPLPPGSRSYIDQGNGAFRYAVSAVGWDDHESTRSIPACCLAGEADREPPHIVLISPPTSALEGEEVWVKARILENRAYECVSSTLHYRPAGTARWRSLPMTRRVKAVFCAAIPARHVTEAGLEYYVEAGDGQQSACFPALAPQSPLTLVTTPPGPGKVPGTPRALRVDGLVLSWQAAKRQSQNPFVVPPSGGICEVNQPLKKVFKDETCWYRIYRSQDPACPVGPATFLTYVDHSTLAYADNGLDLKGNPLRGRWFYRLTAMDRSGRESKPSKAIGMMY